MAELWFYPDGTRILELSVKCMPDEAFNLAVATRTVLTRHGITLSGEQQTKTRKALRYFRASTATTIIDKTRHTSTRASQDRRRRRLLQDLWPEADAITVSPR